MSKQLNDAEFWKQDLEIVLAAINEDLREIFENSEYHIMRNPTNNETCLNVYRGGSPRRIISLWPKRRDATVDFCMENEYYNRINSQIGLPEAQEIKKGKYPGWSKVRIGYAKLREAMAVLAGGRISMNVSLKDSDGHMPSIWTEQSSIQETDHQIAEALLGRLRSTECLLPKMYSEADITLDPSEPNRVWGKVTKSRYNDMKNAVICLYRSKDIPSVDHTKRFTFFEVKVEKGKYRLYCSETLSKYLQIHGKLHPIVQADWDLKYEYDFEDEGTTLLICQRLIDSYQELLEKAF